ncbi:jerky protein homolog-like [Tribolium castaneum]|uniref:jerky protein homolog-like n=1 Tax=Tribolium castaneum TaxID=7070 RepID=UPI00077DB26E|nr:PREDICTED: jerky protein homolog-like [Tribolium castaneum]|eukprot:XP_015833636.1 PREDICTED: jerky protein homolog-like [Tribolium castaneum]
MSPKRRHTTLTIKQKSDIIDRLSRGESGKMLANEYGVGTSTISDIKKPSENYAWFCTQRSRHVPISYDILAAKAKQFYAEAYGNDKFRASRGWISNFRKRHGLRALKVCGEKLSNDQSSVDPFISAITETIQQLNLTTSQIYNADKSALYWKMLPEKTLVRAQEKTAPGRKISKERVTFLACCNADGSHKLKLLVIRKAKNLRAFKNVNIPNEYKNSANAWMTTAIFVEWFHSSFIRQVKNHLRSLNFPQRALLIVDNASSHETVEELTSEDGGEFTTLFLPPNCTALLQPMDQNAIRLIKLFYRKSLLTHILSNNEENVVKVLKGINLKDAVSLLCNAWGSLIKTINNNSDNEYDAEDLIPLIELRRSMLSLAEEVTDVSDMLNELTE